MFFTTVNPMEDDVVWEKLHAISTKPRVAPHNNTWKRLQNTLCWRNLKLVQEKGLQFCQTRSHSTASRFSIHKILGIIHEIYFIL